MRLHFDFNEVSSDIVKTALDYFYEEYGQDNLQFGSISLYVTVRRKEDNANIAWTNKETGRERELYIKSKPIKNTKKKLLNTIVEHTIDDETEEVEKTPKAYIYLK